MIGQTINFVRYGDIPQTGFSVNHAEQKSELGISVYAEGMAVRAEFADRSTEVRGTAKVVASGSDGEPIIDPRTIKLANCSKAHQDDVDCAAFMYQDQLDCSDVLRARLSEASE